MNLQLTEPSYNHFKLGPKNDPALVVPNGKRNDDRFQNLQDYGFPHRRFTDLPPSISFFLCGGRRLWRLDIQGDRELWYYFLMPMGSREKPPAELKARLKAVQSRRTKEEEVQMDELGAEHPWNLTLRQFLSRVENLYGLRLIFLPATDPYGGAIHLWYLQSEDKNTTAHLPGIEPDEQLDPFTTGSLCRRLGIPPEDFGLHPEEPVEDEDLDLGG